MGLGCAQPIPNADGNICRRASKIMRVYISARTTDRPNTWVIIARHLSIWAVCIAVAVLSTKPRAPSAASGIPKQPIHRAPPPTLANEDVGVVANVCRVVGEVLIADDPCNAAIAILAPFRPEP